MGDIDRRMCAAIDHAVEAFQAIADDLFDAGDWDRGCYMEEVARTLQHDLVRLSLLRTPEGRAIWRRLPRHPVRLLGRPRLL
jgi:hypothetical protein